MSNYFWFGGEDSPYLISKSTRFDESDIERTPVVNDYYQVGETAELLSEGTEWVSTNTITGVEQIPNGPYIGVNVNAGFSPGVYPGFGQGATTAVTYGDRIWMTSLSGGMPGYVVYSDDGGTTWLDGATNSGGAPLGTVDVHCQGYNPDANTFIVAGGQGKLRRNAGFTPSGWTGAIYTVGGTTSNNIYALAYSNGTWVASGTGPVGGIIYYSLDDGVSWTPANVDIDSGAQYSTIRVAAGNGVFVAIVSGYFYHSYDGITWNLTEGASNGGTKIIFAGGYFWQGPLKSTDGINWTNAGGGITAALGYSPKDGIWYWANQSGNQQAEIYYSASLDLSSWVSLGPANISGYIYVVSGTKGKVFASTSFTAGTEAYNQSITKIIGKTILSVKDGRNEAFWSTISVDDNGGDATGVVLDSNNETITTTYNENWSIGENVRGYGEVFNFAEPLNLDTDLKTELFALGDTVYQSDLYLAVTDNVSDVTSVSAGLGDWNITSASTANMGWSSVTFGNGKFVAVAGYGSGNFKVMHSPDGINWTSALLSGTALTEANGWNSVAYGNGRYIAVTDSGSNRVMYSDDGANWTARNAAAQNAWFGVVYGNVDGNGIWVAVSVTGGTTRVMKSSNDGLSWGLNNTPNDDWVDVAFGNNTFVAVAIRGSGRNRAMYSTSGGSSWDGSLSVLESWQSVTFGNGKFVAVASTGAQRVAYSTDNGVSWTTVTVPSLTWKSVTFGNGTFVAVADNGANPVMYSTDGINWTQDTAPASAWVSATFGDGKFVSIANTGDDRVMYAGFATNTQVTLGGSTNLEFFSAGDTATQASTELSAPISTISSNVMTFVGDIAFTTGSPLTTLATASATVRSVGFTNDLMVVTDVIGAFAPNAGLSVIGSVRREPKYQSETAVLTGVDGVVDYEIPKSLLFGDTTGTHFLENTPSTNGNRRTWTWSGWLKKTEYNVNQYVTSTGNGESTILFSGGMWFSDGTTTPDTAIRADEPNDSSDWFHLVVAFDTTQGTASDRVRMYINGVSPALNYEEYPNQNEEGQVNSAITHLIGSYYEPANGGIQGGGYSGYLADVQFVDGQALTPLAFGKFNPFGQWIAKDYEDPQLIGTIVSTVGDTQLTVGDNSKFGLLEVGSGIAQDSGYTPVTSVITEVEEINNAAGVYVQVAGQYGQAGTPADLFDGTPNNFGASQWSVDLPSIPFDNALGGVMLQGAQSVGSGWSQQFFRVSGTNVPSGWWCLGVEGPGGGSWNNINTGDFPWALNAGSNVFKITGPSGTGVITRIEFMYSTTSGPSGDGSVSGGPVLSTSNRALQAAIFVNQKILLDGTALTLTDDTDLNNLRVGDAVTETGGDGSGTIAEIGATSLLLAPSSGTWSVSDTVTGPALTPGKGVVTTTNYTNNTIDYTLSAGRFIGGQGKTVNAVNTYGTNGYHLRFDSSDIGEDIAMGNDFTPNNLINGIGNNTSQKWSANPTNIATGYASNGFDGKVTYTAADSTSNAYFTFNQAIPNVTTVLFENIKGAANWEGGTSFYVTDTDGVEYSTGNAAPFTSVSLSIPNKSIIKMGSETTQSPTNFQMWTQVSVNGQILLDSGTESNTVDSPTDYGTDTGLGGEVRGNYATSMVNWLFSYGTLDDGNLTTHVQSGGYGQTQGSIQVHSGKWYWEVSATAAFRFGVTVADSYNWGLSGSGEFSYAMDSSSGNKISQNLLAPYHSGSASIGQWHGVALDLDAGTISFYPEGIDAGIAFNGMPLGNAYSIDASESNVTAGASVFDITFNYGQRPFIHQAPAGYKAINTFNL